LNRPLSYVNLMVVIDEWYEVQKKAIVRQYESLHSEKVESIAVATRVHVVERSNHEPNRVKIDYPLEGWCSIRSKKGHLILAPAPDLSEDEEMESLNLDQKELDAMMSSLPDLSQLKESIQGLKRQREEAEKDLPPAKKPRLDQKSKDFEMDGLRTGMLVEISGLKSEAGKALNGKSGAIESFDHVKVRWRVLVDDKLRSFKPANLTEKKSQVAAQKKVQDLLDNIKADDGDSNATENVESENAAEGAIYKSFKASGLPPPNIEDVPTDPKPEAKPPRVEVDQWAPIHKDMTVYYRCPDDGTIKKGYMRGLFQGKKSVVEVLGIPPRDEHLLEFNQVCQNLPATTHGLSKKDFNDLTVMTVGYNKDHTRILCEFPEDQGVKAIKLGNLKMKRNVICRIDKTSKKELNNEWAVILNWNVPKQRYYIRMLETGKECALKPQNVFI